MNKIAITGIIGSGKSTVGAILTKQGVNFISSDLLSKESILPNTSGYKKLLKLLGPEYLEKNGCFNTKKIATVAFANKHLLSQIENIIHPIVWDLIKKREKKLLSEGINTVFYEIPLLFEKKWDVFFDTWVVIAIDSKKQKNRLKKYRQMSTEEIKNRMQFQTSQPEKIKKADYIIWNNSSIKELEQEACQLINNINKQKK